MTIRSNEMFQKLCSLSANLFILTISACSSANNVVSIANESPVWDTTGMKIPIPRAIALPRIATDELLLEFTIDGEGYFLTRNANDQWTGSIDVPPFTILDLSIRWSFSDIVLAEYGDLISIENSTLNYSVDESDYRILDTDGDTYSNAMEIDAGTNYLDPTSFPGSFEQWPDRIFNVNQTNCATPDFGRESAGGTSYTTAESSDIATVIPTPDIILSDNYSPINLSIGSNDLLSFDSNASTLFLWEVVEITQPGLLQITHISGPPIDSFGALYERNLNGELILISSNDDAESGDTLNFSLAANVIRGGYCYIARHLSYFPILAGINDGSQMVVQFKLD